MMPAVVLFLLDLSLNFKLYDDDDKSEIWKLASSTSLHHIDK